MVLLCPPVAVGNSAFVFQTNVNNYICIVLLSQEMNQVIFPPAFMSGSTLLSRGKMQSQLAKERKDGWMDGWMFSHFNTSVPTTCFLPH